MAKQTRRSYISDRVGGPPGLIGPGLPMILPVHYYLDRRKLAVCLGHHEIPEQSLNDSVIAFAPDEIDPVTRSGWSVRVQGRSMIASIWM